jgi:hypothetical protein
MFLEYLIEILAFKKIFLAVWGLNSGLYAC